MLEHLTACLLAAAENAPAGAVQGVRLAVPGPFDYPAGICKIEGLAKYGALYGVDLRAELGARLAARLGAAAGGYPVPERCGGLCARRAAVRLRQRYGARAVCLHRHRLRQRFLRSGKIWAPAGTARYADGRLHLPLPLRGKRIDDWLRPPRFADAERGDARANSCSTAWPLARRAGAGDAGAQAVLAGIRRAAGRSADPGARRLLPGALLPGRAGHGQRGAVSAAAAGRLRGAGRRPGLYGYQPARDAGRAVGQNPCTAFLFFGIRWVCLRAAVNGKGAACYTGSKSILTVLFSVHSPTRRPHTVSANR